MSEVVKPVQEAQHRSMLGGILGVEFEPCSIAASELARLATQVDAPEGSRPDNSKEYKAVVTKMQVPEAKYVRETSVGGHKRNNDLKNLPFYVVRDFTKHTKMVAGQQEKRTFRKSAVVEEETTYEPGDLWIGYKIARERVLLPIATFDLRDDGNCSYVRLGLDIDDESIFATQTDEQTSRLALIEDFRKLLVHPDEYHVEPQRSKRIDDFVRLVRLRNAEYVAIALGYSNLNMIQKKMDSANQKSAIVFDQDGHSIVYEKAKAVRLTDTEAKHGLLTSYLEAIQPVGDTNTPIVLSAFTRGNVGVPIAEFFPSTNQVQFIGVSEMDPIDQYKIMMAVTALLDEGCKTEFAELTDESTDPAEFLYSTFEIQEKMQRQLKPECDQQERLARAIGGKTLGVCFDGIVKNVNMDKTHGSLSGHVVVDKISEGFEVRIIAKPDALLGKDPTQISFVYDPTCPLGECLPKGQDAKEFAEVIEGFNTPRK